MRVLDIYVTQQLALSWCAGLALIPRGGYRRVIVLSLLSEPMMLYWFNPAKDPLFEFYAVRAHVWEFAVGSLVVCCVMFVASFFFSFCYFRNC
jgi:hypothetical protein